MAKPARIPWRAFGAKDKPKPSYIVMEIQALTRQTGVYGTVNEDDTVTVSDSLGQELIDGGNFKKATKPAKAATPEQVSDRNASGLDKEPIHTDGTNREILNNEGRKLHESGPEASQEAAARVEAGVAPDLNTAPVSQGDDAVAAKKKP